MTEKLKQTNGKRMLNEGTRRNTGIPSRFEIANREIGARSAEVDRPLRAVAYDPRHERGEISFGEAGGVQLLDPPQPARAEEGFSSTVASEADTHEEDLDISANLAVWDRTLRILLGGLLLYLGWGEVVTGEAGTVLKVVGFFVLASGVIGWCLIYTLLGISTRKAATSTHLNTRRSP